MTVPSAPDRCARCGAPFVCGAKADACWCEQWPALAPDPERARADSAAAPAGCLCRDCLREAAGLRIEPAADAALDAAIGAALAAKTMPAGALGEVAALAARLARIQRTTSPSVDRTAIVVFAADHGVALEGVSAYPREVTWQMVESFLAGGAAISVFARANRIDLSVVDAGVDRDFGERAGLIRASMGRGTANLARESAMSRACARAAIAAGARIAADTIGRTGCDAIGFGEMGIGNTTSAAALTARLLGLPASACVGRGTGVDDAALARKLAAVERGLALHAGADAPVDALAALGGFEIAQIAGAILASAARRKAVLIDGYIATAALLVAWRMDPAVLDYCVFAHRSAEPGHRHALEALGARPLLDLGLRLGEGTGAALAVPLLRAAAAMLSQMATFESAGVSAREGSR